VATLETTPGRDTHCHGPRWPPGPGCGGTGTGPAVTRASLHADLAAAHERAARLAARGRQLEDRLSALLGEQAWQQSGLGAPADIDALNRKITHLEQQVTDLRLQLEERDQDLAAARAANRELMAQINAPGGTRTRR
jgi:predicted  nucleic acid-binding Zn-ribbon protein